MGDRHLLDEQPEVEQDYTRVWQSATKIVYSSTLDSVNSARTTIERTFDPGAVRQLKDNADRDLTVGGPSLAAAAIKAGWSTNGTSSSIRYRGRRDGVPAGRCPGTPRTAR